MAGFVILITLSARLSIPMYPVPLTMQTLAIFLTAMILPKWHAVSAVSVYVVLGAVGLPVFADGRSGLEVVFGPTGGFIFGFIIITWLLSTLTENVKMKRKELSIGELAKGIALPCAFASVALQSMGILWGKIHTGSTWPDMYINWLEPFYLNMISKVVLATVITTIIWKKFPEEN